MVPLATARANKAVVDWSAAPAKPKFIGRREFKQYDLADLAGCIDWAPFFQTWDLAGPYPAILNDAVVGDAAARALIGRPELVIADEPTSALDAERQQIFIDLLLREVGQRSSVGDVALHGEISASRSARTALVFVSHDQRLASHFDRTIDLHTINLAVQADAATEPA